ncbi:MAG: PilZ domain-containing protein [Rhodospirillales bacterium]|jgi:hypothetical protein|nr:PilZ domain-containing protein [Rhodospirillales bacterium]MBT5520627.1 PilZ domain-containing protein [Rhodospirillales bacterium]MBT7505851.1 PilZ domain-containing protein [Rhodospirillales bacterium]
MDMPTILATKNKNMRLYQRSVVRTDVEVNNGNAYLGGKLLNFSYGGAAITYPDKNDLKGNSLEVGQEMLLDLDGKVKFPARIVRIFDGGFAAKFDFSIELAMA